MVIHSWVVNDDFLKESLLHITCRQFRSFLEARRCNAHPLVEMWCVYSTSRPSPLNSLGVSRTTTLFMISTKKSAMDGLRYWPARWEA